MQQAARNTCIPYKIRIYLHRMAGLDIKDNVTIGRNTHIGSDVKFVCFTHEIGNSVQRVNKVRYGNITIGEGTWIGCNCTILPDVMIGKGCVIEAGSLVNKDCEDNGVYVGVPAKRIREYF